MIAPGERWLRCNIIARRCWSNDDGTVWPIPFPNETAELVIPPKAEITVANGQIGTSEIPVQNRGPGSVFAPRVIPQSISVPIGEGHYYVLMREGPGVIGPGAGAIPFAVVATAGKRNPKPETFQIPLMVAMAGREPVKVDLTVRRQTPSIEVPRDPPVQQVNQTLQIQIKNTGSLRAADLQVSASLQDTAGNKSLNDGEPVRIPGIEAGGNATVAFNLPPDVTVTKNTRLALSVRQSSGIEHVWEHSDLNIAFGPTLWLLWTAIIVGLALLGVGYFYVRTYRDPLVVALTEKPGSVLGLPPELFPRIRSALERAGRFDKVLELAEVSRRTFDLGERFVSPKCSNGQRAQMLATRLATEPPTIATGDGQERYVLEIPPDRMLIKVPRLVVAFDDERTPPHEVAGPLANHLRDGVGLLITLNPDRRRILKRTVEERRSRIVVPDGGELSTVLVGPAPYEALTATIARQAPIADISLYRVSGGVHDAAMFFGRDREIAQILDGGSKNYLLVGGRQLGKTSILNEVQRRLEQRGGATCVYISLDTRPLWQSIAQKLSLSLDTGREAVIAEIAGRARSGPVYIMIDEADHFVTRDAASGSNDLAAMRGLSDETGCNFLLAGYWYLQLAAADYHSPLRNFGQVIWLGGLEEEACRALATKPLAALGVRFESEKLVEDIVRLCGRRANLIATICHVIVTMLKPAERTVTRPVLEKALASNDLTSKLGFGKGVGDVGSPRDQAIDRIIILGMIDRQQFRLTDVSELFKVRAATVKIAEIRDALTRLSLAFVLEEIEGNFNFRVPLFVAYHRQKDPAYQLDREFADFLGS